MEYRFSIEREDFADYADRVLAALRDWAAGEEGGEWELPSRSRTTRSADKFPRQRSQRLVPAQKIPSRPQMPLNIEVTEGSCKEIFEIL